MIDTVYKKYYWMGKLLFFRIIEYVFGSFDIIAD